MTIQVNIAEAKAKLSALIEAAERGEEVVIARNGEPVAELHARNVVKRRRLGILKERYGWAGPATPIEAFAPDPEDEFMNPLMPGDPST
ncbi:MAG: type II toxin-antitoxin system prevent-host-death family antitoxin [Parvularculaceae bacterium]|nr:type II toxin-antitoxin system prevent-host-death family antitoxin [Parvularculaceae bacterium]